jgi:hypothetical protein
MPRLSAPTLVSALLLTLALNTAAAASNVGPIHLAQRHADHARMIKRYTHHDFVDRGLLDGIADGQNTPTETGSQVRTLL